MIQEPSKDLTLIVYNTPRPPRYIQINKSMLKTLLFAIPSLVVISISFTLFTSFFMKRKMEVVRNKEPQQILDLKEKTALLTAEVEKLGKFNQELSAKIARGAEASGTASSQLALIKTPLGFEDLREKNIVRIENFSNQVLGKKVEFKFDLINNLGDVDKTRGYIIVAQFHSYGVNFYPNMSLSSENQLASFNLGESFTVARFRPVIADFPVPSTSANVWYKIYIFSREGNLLSLETTKEYPIN